MAVFADVSASFAGAPAGDASASPRRLSGGPLRSAFAAADLLAVAVAIAATTRLEGVAGPSTGHVGSAAVLSLPVWAAGFWAYGLYSGRHLATRKSELARAAHAVAVGVTSTAVVAEVTARPVTQGPLVLLFAAALGAVAAEREVARRCFATVRRNGRCCRRVAVAGSGPATRALVDVLERRPELGYRVVALVADRGTRAGRQSAGVPVIAAEDGVGEELRRLGASGAVVVAPEVGAAAASRLAHTLLGAGLQVEVTSGLEDVDPARLSHAAVRPFEAVVVHPAPHDGWRLAAKRALDVVGASVGLVAALPVLALAALAVRLSSSGPVLFRQERVGRDGRTFHILKLRSMYVDRTEPPPVPAGGSPVTKLRHDPRVTPVGRVLRRLSVDELPQLVNVLRGEMSLVGPRPEQPCEVALWAPELYARLRMRPGITGTWQVNGRSEARNTKDRCDLHYVENWSLASDLRILAKTLVVVALARGAY